MIENLSKHKVVKGGCSDCDLIVECDDRTEFCYELIGSNKCFKKREWWETCDKSNTKVGITIRAKDNNKEEYVVKFIFKSYHKFILEYKGVESDKPLAMRFFEINTLIKENS